ncbi:hypothetical protein OVY01_20925 [Robbsia sp. Bb-Pol-6]|uniref:Uncharacterized protein n=1 Tax=Robbsia betulipollinis TaxID=2981849 RepID=A0ABT3ZSS4_9BURK|nr:hypothetical protein [Robbsia betulipollinis]MCY0389614.1 hypothetical protein [Robbsia betulipollinis]
MGTTKPRGKQKAPSAIDRIIGLLADGKTYSQIEICRDLAMPRPTVSRAIVRHRAVGSLPRIRYAGDQEIRGTGVPSPIYELSDAPDAGKVAREPKARARRKSARKAPLAIDLILALMSDGRRLSQAAMVDVLKIHSSTVCMAIRSHRRDGNGGKLHIVDSERQKFGQFSPVWQICEGPDVPMPDAYVEHTANRVAGRGVLRQTETFLDRDFRRKASDEAAAAIEQNLARLRPLAGNVWGICMAQAVAA